MTTDRLEQVATNPDWLPVGWQVRYWPSVESTQDVARRAVAEGAPTNTVFVADHQTAGRGRQARKWLASPGSALLMSVLFRESSRSPVPWRFTSLAALALCDAIGDVGAPLKPAIKWPNDVMLGNRKVAGVLAESAWDGDRLAVVVGMGTNVGTTAAELSQLGASATSLRDELGRSVDRGELLRAVVRRLEAWLRRSDGDRLSAWQARLWGRGQRLRLRGMAAEGVDANQEADVIVLGADDDGALRVRLADGSERRTVSAEIIM
jgi:BirA family transcriptional regulator, biotin operon repressor / biotin---[acetyl-CoA-carboxylase] ligase